jgi:trans-2,3-dihydro-3-hydroxyanthranilate isomerase
MNDPQHTERAPHRFYIVDVFTRQRYTGNQLAVFMPYPDLSDRTMQLLAKEMNYSETTFILTGDEREGGYDVRIFTPESEIPFAGHPTLGTAFVLRQFVIGEPVETVTLNLAAGQIPVTFEESDEGPATCWMRQRGPEFGATIDPADMGPVLGLQPADFDTRYPIQEVSTGLPFVIAPLTSGSALERAQIDRNRCFELLETIEAKAVLIFSTETREPANDLSVRVFADWYGVPEDPATGSANGCLAGWLVRHRFLGDASIDIRVEQGSQIGRPSLLLLKAGEETGMFDIRVGGSVVPIARGELL